MAWPWLSSIDAVVFFKLSNDALEKWPDVILTFRYLRVSLVQGVHKILCVEGFEGVLQRCRRGRGCSELWKNTIFPEHPVCESVGDIGKCVLKSKEYKAYKNMTTVEDFWMKWEILIFFSTNMYTNFEYYLVSTFSLYWFNYGWSGNDYGIPFLQTHYVQILKRILPCLYL